MKSNPSLKNERNINIQAATIHSTQDTVHELPYPPKTHLKKAKNHLFVSHYFFVN